MRDRIVWWEPKVTGEESGLVQEVLKTGFLNDGEYTERFEKEIAGLLGVRYAVAVTSGTTAIFAALAALGVGSGDEVLVPDVTFAATANAVILAGAKPVLVDVDPETFNILLDAIKKKLTPKTKAIVPVHVSGRSADMKAILQFAKEHSLWVVEDAAEALLSRSVGKFLGSFGDAGCFSFSPNKTVMTGQGGMVVTNNERLHVRLREIKDQGRPARGTGGDDVHSSIGFNLKLTNVQAAIGLAQLAELKTRTHRQKRIYEIYASELQGLKGIKIMPFDLAGGEIPQWTDALSEARDPLCEYLSGKGIGYRKFWHPLHRQKPYLAADDTFPVSTQLMPKAFWLPSAFTLSDENILEVCSAIKGFLK